MKLWQYATFLVAALGIYLSITLMDYPPPPPDVTTMIAAPPVNPYVNAISASGIVECFGNTIFLGTSVEGLVQEVFVSVGDHVTENQLLVQLDDRLAKAELATAASSVTVAQAQLEKNISQLERLAKVQDQRAVSTEDLKNKQYDVLVAEDELALAKEQLKQARVVLELTQIRSPKEGVVLRSDYRKGEFASFASSDSPFIMGTISPLQVRADVDEQNAYRIKPNQKAFCYIKGVAEKPITLIFDHIELFVTPKISLTSAVDEKIDTRVLQVIYTFVPQENMPVYVGQRVDVFINDEAVS